MRKLSLADQIVKIIIGYVLSSIVSGYILNVISMINWHLYRHIFDRFKQIFYEFISGGVIIGGLVAIFALLPFVVVISIFEIKKIRRVKFYVIMGACIAVVSLAINPISLYNALYKNGWSSFEFHFHHGFGLTDLLEVNLIFAFSGAISGRIYWRIAGRTAGSWQAVAPSDGPSEN